MRFERITEMPSLYRCLEKMSVTEMIEHINDEDQTVALAVKKALPQVALLIGVIVERLKSGGRLFYIGAGTSGRLGVLDASECAPTYGVPKELVTGIMAGGDAALRFGIEDAEDNATQGWNDLREHGVTKNDVVIGIAASGTTPYVTGALKEARNYGTLTGCIVCNPQSPVAEHADYPVEVIVGPEFVTGITRMKCGTAQKLVLNTISTAVMIYLGRVKGNRMVNMEISNTKLVDRGVKMIMEKGNIADYENAKELLLENGSVALVLAKIEQGTRGNPD
ncbi:MAG TPA: N-acetylmuramic acid 6-phosphate etherase [Puia sp.]|nr:N-acetylmuramic acid 6-phosphate etherase [Puia sp.]